MAMDRSKYQNPEMPVGYVKKDVELRYKEGIEIDGYHYIYAPLLYEARIDLRDDFAILGHLVLSSDEDDCILDAAILGESSTLSPGKIKKENDDGTDDVEKRINKHDKKSHVNISTLDASFAEVEIDAKKKKKGKSKKGKKNSNRSDSSDSSSSHRYRSPSPNRRHHSRRGSPTSNNKRRNSKERIVTYSPSPSPPSSDRYHDRKIKQEYDDMEDEFFYGESYYNVKVKKEFEDEIKKEFQEPQHLFGSYHCDVCNITMNSELTYNTHIVGKRHRKNEKLKNIPESVARCIPAAAISEDESKYPRASSGVIRKKVNVPAKIQKVLETITVPCPGLNFVIEIQGVGSVQYYCSLCDSVCSSNSIISHLVGYKHSLRLVKEFKPGDYEQLQYQPKHKIEAALKSMLRAIQKKEGMGRMKVEIDELVDSKSVSDSKPSTSRDYRSIPSTSKDYRSIPSTSKGITGIHPGISPSNVFKSASIPKVAASDFYCKVCQSHMNSQQMWDAHIRGKRHLTNIKKLPGDLPSKTKTIQVPNKKAYLLDRIKYDCPRDEPFVGLNQVRETEIYETNSHSYQCFLCGSCHTSLDILEHLMSLKHRTKYLDYIDFPGREVISGMGDHSAYELVKEMCLQVEEREGPGNPEVHISKNRLNL